MTETDSVNPRLPTAVRVLQLVADGAPGGGTTAVLGLSKSLMAEGWKVTLVTQPNSYAFSQAIDLGLEVIALDFFVSRFDFTLPHQIAAIIERVRPELIHAHGGRAMHPFCWPPLNKSRMPLLYTVHGYHFAKKRNLLRWMGKVAEVAMAKRAYRVIFVGESDKKIATSLRIIGNLENVEVIYNAVDCDDFAELSQCEKTHDLIFAGRMHPQKNPLFAIDIMAALKGTGTKLLMVGGGELENLVHEKAKKLGLSSCITFTGALSRAETIRRVAHSKIYLSPSLWEGLPIGPIEALACGVPVVASNIPGTDEVVKDNVHGVLIEQYDPLVYARTIKNLLADPTRLDEMSKSGRRFVMERFNHSVNISRHIEVYRSALEPPIKNNPILPNNYNETQHKC